MSLKVMSGCDRAPRIVRSADAVRMRWRNGGGETAEVAVHPPGAALDAFGWRVSLATITAGGPFSTFQGVDRTLALLAGGGLVLAVGADPPTRLDVEGEPLRFAGGAPCRCSLAGGPATALNVMTARGWFDCAVSRLGPAPVLSGTDDGVALLVCADGEVGTDIGPLGRLDVLIVPAGAAVGVGPDRASGRAWSVSVWRVGRGRPR